MGWPSASTRSVVTTEKDAVKLRTFSQELPRTYVLRLQVAWDFGQDAVWIPGPAEETAPDRLRHVLKVFLVDDQRRVRNVYSTGMMDVRLVMNDLRTVIAEAR